MKLLRNFFPVKKYMKKFEAALRTRRKFDMTSRYSVQKAGPHIPGDISANQVHSFRDDLIFNCGESNILALVANDWVVNGGFKE